MATSRWNRVSHSVDELAPEVGLGEAPRAELDRTLGVEDERVA
jgi:hypothetical protein